jgi:hypothetical protein
MKRRISDAQRRLGQWHLRVGLAAAVVLVALAATGIALNHGRELGLERRYVQTSWLLDWYGITAPRESRGVTMGDRWVCELDGRVFLDAQEIPGVHGRLKGAVQLEDMIAVAVEDRLWLLTATGAVIEQFGAEHGLPQPVRTLGRDDAGRLVLKAGAGVFVADDAVSSWQRAASRGMYWSAPTDVPPALRERLAQAWRGRGLSLERVLADVHSGRFFGRFGVWVVDLAALAALVLALSGPWLWFARRRANHKPGKGRQGGSE